MRPCKHTRHVEDCRICAWCVDDSAKGRAYRARWGEPEPEPSLLARGLAFAGAAARHLLRGLPMVDDNVYDDRLAACAACTQFVENTCRLCGCRIAGDMLAKARWADQSCPLGKWAAPSPGVSSSEK